MSTSENDIRPYQLLREQKKRFQIDINNIKKRIHEFCFVNCPSCNANNYKLKFKKFNFQYVACQNCETSYVNPRPTPEIIKWYYTNSENYKFWNKYTFPLSEKSRIKSIIKPRINRILEICEKENVKKDLFVEVGPGFGTFGQELIKTNYFSKFLAIEPMPDLAETCRKKGLDVIEENIEDIKLNSVKATVIGSFEVIEHLFSPLEFLKGINKQLKKDGLIFITCPNINGFEVKTLGKISDTYDIEHLNYFSIESLSSLIEKSGFKVIQTMTPGLLDADIVRKKINLGQKKISNKNFLHSILIKEWDQLGNSFQKFLSENKLSTHMWIVAKKTQI